MIHPAYFIIFSIIQAAALLMAVSFGFRAGYAAYAKKEPPGITLPVPVPQKPEEEMPEPISPTKRRREQRQVEVP